MATRKDDSFGDTGDADALRFLMDAIAAEDSGLVRELLRENASLAEAVMSDAQVAAAVREVLSEMESITKVPTPADADADAPGLFTELTRELSPQRAEALYRKVVPLLVYEMLRALDQSANIATVQQIVDHLCSREMQTKLRGCSHVRDGILDEITTVLASAGINRSADRRALNRDDVLAIMNDCGVTGELMTLVNCVRLLQANAG